VFRTIGGLLPGIGVAGLVGGAINKAFDLDTTRVQLGAFVGGVDKANIKLAEFSKIAQSTAGVTRQSLTQAFIDLKAQARLADDQASKLAVSIAKLQALFPKAQDTARNLAQIFSQGFELQDIKQERGQTGDFIDSVIKRLGFEGPKNVELIRKAKEAGKLTQGAFWDAVDAEVVSRSKNLTESLQLRMTKALEATNEKLAQLGDKLLKDIIPILDKLLPPLNKVLEVFTSLPTWLQATTIGIVGLAGPVANLTQAIGGLRGAMVGLGAFMTGPAGIAALAAIGLVTAGVGLNDLLSNQIPANVRSGLGLQDRSLLTPDTEKLDIPSLGLRVENGKIVRGGSASTRAAAAAAKVGTSRAARARAPQKPTVDLLAFATGRQTDIAGGQRDIEAHMSDLSRIELQRQRDEAQAFEGIVDAIQRNKAKTAREAEQAAEKAARALEKSGELLSLNERFARGFASQMETVGDAFDRFGANVARAFGNVRDLFRGLKDAVLGFFNDILGSALQNLVRGTLGGIFGGIGSRLGGLGGGTFGGSIFSQALASGAGGGISVPSSVSQSSGLGGILGGIFGGGGSGGGASAGQSAGGGFSLGGLLGGLAGAAPLLGAGLGSGIGGKSTLGNIFGAIGGGAVGLGVSFGASVFGAGGGLAAASLAALGPIALIGAPLLIGGLLLGKAKQRRSDEQAAGEFLRQALSAIDQLAAGISSGQIDGSQARSIFDTQILAEFKQQISGLKTKSVVQSRLTNQVRDLEAVYQARIPPLIVEQQARQATQAANALAFSRQVPEFATGGTTLGGLARLHPGEKVLNFQQQANVRAIAGANIFERAGVPGIQSSRVFDNGGTMPAGGDAPLVINLDVTVGVDSEKIVVRGASTENGRRVIIKQVRNSQLNKE
jgi:hypothetical protein